MFIEKTFFLIFAVSIVIILAGAVLIVWAIVVFFREVLGPKDIGQDLKIGDLNNVDDELLINGKDGSKKENININKKS